MLNNATKQKENGGIDTTRLPLSYASSSSSALVVPRKIPTTNMAILPHILLFSCFFDERISFVGELLSSSSALFLFARSVQPAISSKRGKKISFFFYL